MSQKESITQNLELTAAAQLAVGEVFQPVVIEVGPLGR